MSDKNQEWTKKEVAEAFAYFRNPSSATSEEETAAKLAKILEEFPQGLISTDDIRSISERLVMPRCVSAMTAAIIGRLEENRKSN